MPLTVVEVRNAKPGEKPYKVADEKGLYLFVTPKGVKSWRLKYRYGGKEKVLTFGQFPEVALAEARERREAARATLRLNKDPAVEAERDRRAAVAAAGAAFKVSALAWHEDERPRWSADYTTSDNSWDILKMIAQAGGGEVFPVGAQLSCTFHAPRVSIGTITANDIMGDVDVPGTSSRRLRRNTVIPRVRLESHGWEEVPLDAIAIADFVAMDGGSRPTEISFPLVQQVDQGAQLGLYAMWNGREIDGIVLPSKVYAIGYRPGDCLTVDIPDAALNARDVVVREREIEGSSMAVTLTCRTETHAKHPFCLGKTGKAPPTPDLSVPESYPIGTARAAYLIVRQSIAYPLASTANAITISAFDATIDDGRVLSLPAQTITGLDASSTYIVLWDLAAQSFVAAPAPALTESASSNYVIVRQMTTQNADGTYPTQPPAPGGDGGGGYGGGGCPIVTARILLANKDRSGPGETIAAGDIEPGAWVWAQLEADAGSDRFGAYRVTFKRVFDSPLTSVGDRPLTSPSHLWWMAGGWMRSDAAGLPAGSGRVVALTVEDAHTYVLVATDGTWLLSHNKVAQQTSV